MSHTLWWITQIIFSLLGVFFLLFGVFILISAYHLDNPVWFILTFFSSNLIILISGALLVGFILRMFASRKDKVDDEVSVNGNAPAMKEE